MAARSAPRSRSGWVMSITACCGCTDATIPISAIARTSSGQSPSTCSIVLAPCRGAPKRSRASRKISIAQRIERSPIVWMRVAMPRSAAAITYERMSSGATVGRPQSPAKRALAYS